MADVPSPPTMSVARALATARDGATALLLPTAANPQTSFAEVRTRARRIAHVLRRFGGDGARQPVVACMLPNVPMHVVVHYAVAFANAIVVNVNTRLSAAEVEHQLSDARATLLIAHTALADVVLAATASTDVRAVVWVDDDGTETVAMAAALGVGATTTAHLRLDSADGSIMPYFPADARAAAAVGDSAYGTTPTQAPPRSSTLLGRLLGRSAPQPPPPAPPSSSPTAAAAASLPYEMLYTSGTSGRPKGVVHTQRAVIVHATTAALEFGFVPTDVWLHAAPLFHAMDLFAVFALPLVNAAQATTGSASDPRALFAALTDARATCTALAPTSLRLLLAVLNSDGGGRGGGGPLSPSSIRLRMLSTGGQALSAEFVRAFTEAFPACAFYGDYGMTEAGGKLCVTLFGVPHGPMEPRYAALTPADRLGLLCATGRPFASVELRLLELGGSGDDDTPADAHGKRPGEVAVRGLSVFRGYFRGWGQAASTADFVNGWFRTGDVAEPAGHGFVRIVDRKKVRSRVGGCVWRG